VLGLSTLVESQVVKRYPITLKQSLDLGRPLIQGAMVSPCTDGVLGSTSHSCNIGIVCGTDRVIHSLEVLGVRTSQSKDVSDCQYTIPPLLSKSNTAPDGRVRSKLIRCRRIKHDEVTDTVVVGDNLLNPQVSIDTVSCKEGVDSRVLPVVGVHKRLEAREGCDPSSSPVVHAPF